MRVAPIPLDDPRWVEFTSVHPDAGPFHLPAWAQLIADCYHFDTFVLAAFDTDGELLAGAPTIVARSPLGRVRWVSLPFSDSCTLLVRQDVDTLEVVESLRDYALAGPAADLEIRSRLPEAASLYLVNAGYIYQMELPKDPADLHPHKAHRWNRNTAIRAGVTVTRGTTPEEMATFYRFQTLTRRRHGVPVQPKRFFDLIRTRLLEPGHGFIATSSLDGQPLAAAVYLQHNGRLIAKYHASDPSLPYVGAGHLLEWEVMVAACREGIKTLDIGRTDLGHEGLRAYKKGWGHTESELVYTHIARKPPKPERSGVGSLPRAIIHHSPLWVGRAAGELLYRWTA